MQVIASNRYATSDFYFKNICSNTFAHPNPGPANIPNSLTHVAKQKAEILTFCIVSQTLN